MKIVFLDAASIGEDVSLEPISSLGELITYPFTSPEQVEERISDCDVLIINKVQIRRQQIDWGKNLKLICIAATGTNNVDYKHIAVAYPFLYLLRGSERISNEFTQA